MWRRSKNGDGVMAVIDRVVGRWAAGSKGGGVGVGEEIRSVDGDVGDRVEERDGDDSDVTETLGMDTVSCAYGAVTTAGAVDGEAL